MFGENGDLNRDNHYYPFGMKLVLGFTGGSDNKFLYNGKELEDEHGLNAYDYVWRRYYPDIGKWWNVDPADEFYSPYSYGPNNPINGIDPDGRDWFNLGTDENPDIQWRDGSDPQLKPGFLNWLKNLFVGGEYATSLGEDVLVVYGGAPNGNGIVEEAINEATFELYLSTNRNEATASSYGNTVPADQIRYATIAAGFYTAALTTYHGLPALLINGGGIVPTIGNNPNPRSNYYVRNGADEIFFHAGNRVRLSLTTRSGRPISAGCLTGCSGHRQDYLNFINNFQVNWTGNVYLIRR